MGTLKSSVSFEDAPEADDLAPTTSGDKASWTVPCPEHECKGSSSRRGRPDGIGTKTSGDEGGVRRDKRGGGGEKRHQKTRASRGPWQQAWNNLS